MIISFDLILRLLIYYDLLAGSKIAISVFGKLLVSTVVIEESCNFIALRICVGKRVIIVILCIERNRSVNNYCIRIYHLSFHLRKDIIDYQKL